jgi:nitrate reductase NapD
VVVDVPDAGRLGTILNTIALLPNVYSAALVFHAIDAASAGELS